MSATARENRRKFFTDAPIVDDTFIAPPAQSGPAAAAATDPAHRDDAHAADAAAHAAERARQAALAAPDPDEREAQRQDALAKLRAAALREYMADTGRAVSADERAHRAHRRWAASYQAAIAAGCDPASLVEGLQRRHRWRPELTAPPVPQVPAARDIP